MGWKDSGHVSLHAKSRPDRGATRNVGSYDRNYDRNYYIEMWTPIHARPLESSQAYGVICHALRHNLFHPMDMLCFVILMGINSLWDIHLWG